LGANITRQAVPNHWSTEDVEVRSCVCGAWWLRHDTGLSSVNVSREKWRLCQASAADRV